jgi:hypothetical protein
MFISPPMCQLCTGRREKGRLARLSTRLISQRNVTLRKLLVKSRDDGTFRAFL